MKGLSVALVGVGTVGSGVFTILHEKAAMLATRTGVPVTIAAVCDKDVKKLRALHVPKHLIVSDVSKVLADPAIDCIIELVGGKGFARDLILKAFENGKDVVTANKALLAEFGDEIFATARRYRRQIYFEASVGGGIPIIKAIRESLASNKISSILSIINGTANYILTKMTVEKMDFKQALGLAQAKGYAEADPTFDVEGIDAGHKITVLSRLVFERNVRFKDVACAGISRIQPCDIAFADEFGYVIKLLAIAKKVQDGIEVRVQPTLLPKGHILANVNDAFNAVFLHGDEVGDMLFYGRGAGSRPTASAVVSDLCDLAKEHVSGQPRLPYPIFAPIAPKKLTSISSRYYLRFSVIDKPGVLSRISHILGTQSISISDVMQRERQAGKVVPVIVLTHEATESALQKAIVKIDTMDCIKGKTQVLRIEQ